MICPHTGQPLLLSLAASFLTQADEAIFLCYNGQQALLYLLYLVYLLRISQGRALTTVVFQLSLHYEYHILLFELNYKN